MRIELLPEIRVYHEDARMQALIGGVRDLPESTTYLETHARHWTEHGFGFWMLRDMESGEACGLGGLRRLELGGVTELEVGYGFRSPWWGKGLATEVTARFLEIARTLEEFASVVAVIHPDNAGSIRVVGKLGFRFEGEAVVHGKRLGIYRLEP